MASALTLMKNLDLGFGHGKNGPALGTVALDTSVGFAVSYGIGRAYHQYGDKWAGKNAPRIAAVVGKVGSAVLQLMSGGAHPLLAGALDAAGQAGVDAIGLEMGLRHAREATGKKAVLLPKDAALPAGATDMPSIGAGTNSLSYDQIAEMAAMK